mmetsp:Transcript_3368/g.4625  ORF Transcript_3368/g.4625 Transcript_3368/m.4625 type:complete len:280 (+) Transcript_3368:169-1008(+)
MNSFNEHSPSSWQVSIIHFLQFHQFHPKLLVQCGIFPGNTLVLIIFRGLVFLYLFLMFILGLIYADWKNAIKYYSDVQFFFVAFYFLSTLILSVRFRYSIGRQSRYNSEETLSANHFELFLWVLFEMVAINAYFLDVVYWFLLHEPPVGIYAIGAHILNVVLITVELFLNKLEVSIPHIIFTFLCGFLYVLFAWFWYGVTGDWVYYFLDWSTQTAAISYFMLVIFGVMFFFLVKGFVTLRNQLIDFLERSKTFEELKEWEQGSGFNQDAMEEEDDEFLT